MIKKTVVDDRYRFKLTIVVGVTCEQAKAEAKKLGFEFEDSQYGGFDGNMYEGIMWAHKKPDLATIAHECSHVALHVMHHKGIPITYENDEGIAYFQEYWFKSVREALK
jgi:hypothetical protein